ncbi:MAG: class I SAM-dependent methyltransferase [Bacteroidota bacterium]|nr:class I SAM-dependent methyltransferase [Bacteroidota bacterium]
MHNEDNRRNWVKRQLEKLPANARLLDAGAGEQQYKPFCAHLKYVSQDFAAYKPENMDSGLQMASWDYGKLDIISDITSIPQADGSFDAILCTEVFEHIPDAVAAIKEISRLLKKGGILILTAPFTSMTHFAPYHFATGFNRFFYEHHLPEAGLKINELSFNGNYFDVIAQELQRMDHVAIKYANDKPSWLEYRALKMVKKMTARFSAKEKGTTELMALGVHVVATKM